MLKSAIGHSCDPDSEMAIAEVLEQCQVALNNAPQPRAGILFAAYDFDHASILQKIKAHFPNIALIGSTSYGEISSVLGFEQDSIVLLLLCSDTIEMQAGVGRNVSQDPSHAAQQAIQQAVGTFEQKPQLCITTPESLTVSCVTILESLQQALGKSFPIVGGFAAEPWTFETTYQFFDTEVLTDAVPVLLLFGDVRYSTGVACGWEPIGKPAQVTKVEGKTVYEIDGEPALNFLEHSLGGRTPSAEYPLAVFEPRNELFYLRGCVGYDKEFGTVSALADVPLNTTVQVAQASRHNILDATQTSIQKAIDSYPGEKPAIALFFTCCCRQQILGTYTGKEFFFGQNTLGTDIPIVGFYTYGEIAPLVRDCESKLHQMTFVTVLIGAE
ncbi:FIST N-terminal domain-containing protein [Tumidithrix helvetica PCC 7403]|uniref:FIST signal transduction protein n=1 Tax=Tumidithrix helvetica TaxID=3457545 RepID=UPI003C8315E9